MSFSLFQLFLIGTGYLLLLFGIAHITDRGWIPKQIVRHPLTYILSLGVYASAWAFYGAVGFAYEYGYGFLTYYLGLCGAFLLAPVLLLPIFRLTRTYQLSSLADLLTFRYRSQWAGSLVTLFMVLGTLSLLSLQIQAFTSSGKILAPKISEDILGVGFCVVITVFSILFGARMGHSGEHNDGLVMSIAFESLVKLTALLILGSYALFEVFGGMAELDEWLQTYGIRISALERTLADSAWRSLLLIFFASAIVLPHMFHMAFTEGRNPQALFKASWGVPIYLLLMSLPIQPILWAGIKSGSPTLPEYFTLGITLASETPWLSIIAFIGGLSAASGLIIVSTLALSGMVLNHIVLPIYPPPAHLNIYRWLTWVRRGLIAIIITLAYLFYMLTEGRMALAELGILAFSGLLQLLPGILAVLYWPLANRIGFLSGLIIGIVLWCLTMLFPLLFHIDPTQWLPIDLGLHIEREHWYVYTLGTLTINVTVFVLVSLLSTMSREEESAAQACSVDTLSRPQRRELVATSSEEFKQCLAKPLGAQVAAREVEKALHELTLPNIEYRPYALRRLRDQIEVNLSGLMGPKIAQNIVKQHLSFKPLNTGITSHDIHFVERSLEDYQSRLTGLAAELDSLRRYHRQTLQNLPIAACSLGSDLEILMWNQAMEDLTGIAAEQVIGAHLSSLPGPWSKLLKRFAEGEQAHQHKQRVDVVGQPRWFNLHKSTIEGPRETEGGIVVLIEDQTELRILENELIHSERLASVGRLAAGVAHEIGNPVTGIACLAQNMKLETNDDNVLDIANQVLTQTKRISSILQTLMNFSRTGNHSQANQHAPADIHRCVSEAIKLLSLNSKNKDIQFHNECSSDLIVIGDEQRLVQVFINLLSNACDASEPGGNIFITGNVTDYSAIIEVSDEGSGIPEDQLDHIFEPFYTTKGPDEGTGLGLALVYSIIEEHYGHIQVISPAHADRPGGTKIIINLPAQQNKNHSTGADSIG